MGLATAKLLAERGAAISLADINEDAMIAAVKSLKDSEKHMYTVVDVRNSEAVNSWIESTVRKLGQLDGAVNMAGVIAKAVPTTEVTDSDWDFSFAVNTKGVFNCLRAELKAMTAGASIVGVSCCEIFYVIRVKSLPHPIGICSKRLWTVRCARKCCLLC